MEYNNERLKADGVCSYNDFVSLVEFLTTQVFGQEMKFLRDTNSNPKNINIPCVTEKLLSKKAGAIGKNTLEIKPRIREQLKDPDHPNEVIIILGQVFDAYVRFDIWAENDVSATQLADRFESMMLQYVGFIKKKGIGEVIFLEQLQDSDAQSLRLDLSCRSLKYYVRFEQLTVTKTYALKTIELLYRAKVDNSESPDYEESIVFPQEDEGSSV